MAKPSVVVRIAFGSDIFASSPSWTDVSSDVISIRIKKGRKHVMARMESGVAEVVLKNTSANYWPDNTGGSYYDNIKVDTRINIRAVYDSVTYDLYTGFIIQWVPSWRTRSGTGAPIMTVLASDLITNMSIHAINNGGEAEELSGTRVGNILDDLGWPNADRDLDAGQTTVRAISEDEIANTLAWAHLLKVQESEGGIIFIAGDGDVQFQSRHARLYSPFTVSQGTFDNSAGNSVYQNIELVLDDKLLFNDVRCLRDGDGATEQTVSSSPATYGPRSLIKTGLLNTTDADVSQLAHYYLYLLDVTVMRVKSLRVTPDRDDTDLFPKILSWDISTRITVILSQASISKDYHIESIEHEYVAGQLVWRTQYQLTVANEVVYWKLGEAGEGELGQFTKLAY